MSGHAFIAPSSLYRSTVCTAYPMLYDAVKHLMSDTNESIEGNCAHAVAVDLIQDRQVNDGDTCAQTGIIITKVIIDSARVYAKYVIDLRKRADNNSYSGLEQKLSLHSTHPDRFGTVDSWVFDLSSYTLHVTDFKHGHGFVSEIENLQLIDYARGVIDYLGIDGHHEQSLKLELTIVQPRCYSHAAVRTWRINATDIRPHINFITSKIPEMLSKHPRPVAGGHCRNCELITMCDTSRTFAGALSDAVLKPQLNCLTNDELGVELLALTDTVKILNYRKTALESLAEDKLRGGERVQNYQTASTRGRKVWDCTDIQLQTVVDLTEIELFKKERITPTQAINAGVNSKVVEGMCKRQTSGVKIQPIDFKSLQYVFRSK